VQFEAVRRAFELVRHRGQEELPDELVQCSAVRQVKLRS
jgi:hypothetical protein